MNFAIQCLEESIIGSGGYQSELTPYKRGIHPLPILFSFNELIHLKLLSKEYYEGKGHKVLGKMIDRTNSFEIDPSKSIDSYEKSDSYLISFMEKISFDDKEITFTAYDILFIGSKEKATELKDEMLKMLTEAYPDSKFIVSIENGGKPKRFKELKVR